MRSIIYETEYYKDRINNEKIKIKTSKEEIKILKKILKSLLKKSNYKDLKYSKIRRKERKEKVKFAFKDKAIERIYNDEK